MVRGDWALKLPLLILMSAAASTDVAADPAADCNRFDNVARQIRGCTDYIRGGSALSENLAVAYTNRGIAYASRGDRKRALQDFTEAMRLAPESPYPYYNRGNTYYDLKDFPRALEDYNAAIERGPELALAFYNRGLTYEKLGDREKSIADFQQSLSLDPSSQLAKQRLNRLGVQQ
jgi:tetratricopeptide (TPR) repeat protein